MTLGSNLVGDFLALGGNPVCPASPPVAAPAAVSSAARNMAWDWDLRKAANMFAAPYAKAAGWLGTDMAMVPGE
jgi:hypothetical protein